MAEDKNLTQLIINEMTKAQYEALPQINEDEIYVLTDVDNTIHTDNSTLQGNGSIENPIGLSDTIISTLNNKQNKLTAGTNITISDDNIISSTAQESFFRGRWETWGDVPSNTYSYPEDLNGNRTPTTNDYMVVVDASQYTPDMNDSIVISKDKNSHYIIINGVSVGFPNQIKTYTYDTVTYSVENISGGMVIKLYADKTVQYRERIIPAGATIINTTYSGDAIEPANLYYSKLDNLSGAWRFGYKGVWAVDNQSGWKPEYQIEDTLPMATETQAGINKTYTAGVNIRIEDNVISSTAQESFFRGRYENWDTVPTNGQSYPNDINGNHIPSNTDYIIIEDSSTVPGGQVDVQMTMETDAYLAFPNKKLETVINGITYNGTGIFDDGNIEVFCNADAGNYTAHWKTLKNNVEYQGVTYEAGSVFFKVIIRPEKNTTQNAKLSLGNPYTGSWRFSYRGAWDLDNKNGWKAEYQIEDVLPIATETQAGINRTYTAGANIRIEDNVISSTAQESFFRGRFAEWTSVPTSSADYTADFHGNTTPSYNDYIVVEDSSLYMPQDFLSDPNNVMIRNLHSAGTLYTIEVVIQDQIRRIYYTECTNGEYAQINDWLSVTYEGGVPGVWYIKTNKEFYINNVFTPTANKLLLLKTDTPYETNFYLSEKPGVAPLPIYGSWRFVYHGVWADDNILGWKPEYQIEDTLPIADEIQAGIAKLYKTSGSNTDGAMTQRAVGNAISAHNTATDAHSNIRGVAGGLATLDNNAKVPMSQINDALIGNVSYQGLWDAASNTPFLVDPTGGLPAGYKALGYIDFRTEAFIDTGIFIDEADETVEYDIKMAPSNTGCFPFGAAGSSASNHNTGSLYFYGSKVEYFAGNTRDIRLGEVVKDKDYIINIKIDQTTQTITVVENDLRTTQTYAESIISPVPIILGGLYFGSESSPQRAFGYAGKIYYFIIRKNGVTVKQYQPAQRISDGAYGFYEHVSGEFAVSTGVSFTSGGGEIEIPKGYYYITTVAGDRFGLHFDVGDWIISAGGYWSKVDNTDAVVSVNGRTGNVVVTAEDLDLSNYVQKTDIATHKQAGLLLGVGSGFRANIYGMPQCDSLTTVSYPGVADSYFISKGSIENLKDDIVKRAITANSITLTEEEQTAAKTWLGVTDADLSNYVQKTDYASSKEAGLIRGYNANGFGFVPDTGYPYCENKSLASYNSAGDNLFIGKGTLEAIKYSYVRDGIANNTYSLSNTEKEKVRNWIGAGVPTVFDVMPDLYVSAGKTYQYVGETTEEFTSGYFYKSVSQGLSYIASDRNLTFDFDLFWSELESAGITLETLQMTEADKERGGFSIIGTVESETNYRVENINGIPLDVLLTQSIQSTSEYVGANNRWYYKPMETFSWERVDVQPALTKEETDATYLQLTGGTITGTLNVPELNVATPEGTLNLSIAAGVATITTNNGLDIASQTKFDTTPTTDDNTTWADASEVSLVRKAQVATAIADVEDDINDLQTQVNTRTRVIIRRWE